MEGEFKHTPVMLEEVLQHLSPGKGEVVVDCTLGGAGHSIEMAKRIGHDGTLIGIDQDKMAREFATQRLNTLPEQTRPQIVIANANFSELDDVLIGVPVPGIDCVLFDLGVSSVQLDVRERGFTYHENAPLDMRMNPDSGARSAEDVINEEDEKTLSHILRVYGEEKFAEKIAKNICLARENERIKTSDQLVEIVKASIPAAARRTGGHPAKRTFQAFRIYVNDELGVLEVALEAAIRWLNPRGRICVISYHSLEDRIVKEQFRKMEDRCTCPPEIPICQCGKKPILKAKPRGAILPSDAEVATNPRARSAKMRVAIKLEN